VLALVIGVRHGFAKEPMRPHNLPFVMVGAALLWIGWFGFNAGSAGGANGLAGLAWLNTFVATAVAILAWLATEKIRDGHATSLGGASGAVAGLVAITPAAGFVSPIGAIVMGAAAGVLCAIAVGWKYKLGFDDSLDVVGVHLVGGLLGTILTGLFATETGLFYGHGPKQLIAQILAAVVTIIFSAAVTAVIALAIKATIGWRIGQAEEISGIDLAVHSETAYETISSARVAGRS
jgi:Amt family ammonium transporter